MDPLNWKILQLLQKDGRMSLRELGRRVHLSTPAVSERVRRMEAAGIITGYRAEVDMTRLGKPVQAFINYTVSNRDKPAALKTIRALPEIVACYHVAGAVALILVVQAENVARLEDIATKLGRHGDTVTHIVLSTTFKAEYDTQTAHSSRAADQ
ncbi:MAG TPA: Lrp/AsnC family transcriptional regulator [Anaerolineales bacterium]|nr:Lrp/AsnC family transcriptional regulator [Anaerolineales bacterium]HRF49752.1 Lrp/AsnC family transcriptional regulator [Anaerolineales bacterium]